jgi:hypothetical protein
VLARGEVPGYYNLWRGFAVEPVAGDWRRPSWSSSAAGAGGSTGVPMARPLRSQPMVGGCAGTPRRAQHRKAFSRGRSPVCSVLTIDITHAKHLSRISTHLADCVFR